MKFFRKTDARMDGIDQALADLVKELAKHDHVHDHPLRKHDHLLQEHDHSQYELKHKHFVPIGTNTKLVGTVECRCGHEYDLQRDCHVGAALRATVICDHCKIRIEVGPEGVTFGK